MSRAPLLAALLLSVAPARGQSAEGYYRYPTLHGDLVVFCAEGDLWTVPTGGGSARRLTTHPGEEIHPVISPDGRTVAFTAAYEGPAELYTMSLDGGLPTRWTYEAEPSVATTWTPAGDLVYTTSHYSTLPDLQLVALDLETGRRRRVPLSQASEGAYDSDGATLFFVRPAFHRQVTRRYRGGTARQIWRFVEGADEAELLTTDHRGESHTPMWWNGRLYFITDRDGTMNIWSMAGTGGDLQQHTEHSGWDVRDASLNEGRIVYQVGADLWLYDIARDRSRMLSITLASDFDQLRERWVKTPMDYLTSVHLHPEGESVVLTARGRVFVAPAKQGRLSRVSREKGVRYRDAVFMPDGGTILALSDATGELEFVTVPATGIGDPDPVTRNGTILRFQGHPSPDGKWIAYTDNNKDLWLLSVESREQRVLSTNREGVGDIAWAPDSRWLTFSQQAANSYVQILLYRVDGESPTALTSDRVNSRGAVWSPDGEWIYFLSDRNVKSIVRNPWGPRQPEAYFDKPVKVYQVALRKGLRSPFKADDELYTPPEDEDTEGDEGGRDEKDGAKKAPSPVEIDLEGLPQRVREVPIEAGSLGALALNEEAIFWTSVTRL